MMTIFRCSHCGKELSKLNRDYMGKHNITECPECIYHIANGTNTIANYNKWLKGQFSMGKEVKK